MAIKLRPEQTDISFRHESPTLQADQDYQENLHREEDLANAVRDRWATVGGKQHTRVYAGPGQLNPAGVGVYREAKAAVQPKIPHFHKGGKVRRTGAARLKANETVNGKLVPRTGVYRVQKGDQVLTPQQQHQAQPVSRWTKIGPSMDDHLRKFGLI